MKMLFAAILVSSSVSAVEAVDLKDLLPCKSAAAKYCDRSGGMTMENLARCGATLAALSEQLGNQCRQVLRRYGQI